MPAEKHIDEDETKPLTGVGHEFDDPRASIDSSTASISFALANKLTPNARGESSYAGASKDLDSEPYRDEDRDFQDEAYVQTQPKPVQRKAKIIFWVLFLLCLGGWSIAFVLFLFSYNAENASTSVSEPQETSVPIGDKAGKKKITLDQVMKGEWSPRSHSISWIPGPRGEDGLLLKQEAWAEDDGYLRVEDIKSRAYGKRAKNATVLMQKQNFFVGKTKVSPSKVWPSPDWKTVLVLSDEKKTWRHSFTGIYWLFDVDSQTGQPLDPDLPDGRIQLASWSPKSDAVVFTRENNMFIRKLSSEKVEQITTDGGAELFYGVPDWVYEEEVYEGNSVTWWSEEGQYVAFLRTNESTVPDYPVQYYLSRPSGAEPAPGEENYPDVRNIKYPKAGAPNPIVNLMFYDFEKNDVFSIDVPNEFSDDNRLIIEVVWASGGKVLVRETNRESDVLNLALVDVSTRTGKIVRIDDIAALDGGWVEPSQSTRFIPADPSNERLEDGYIETIISEGRDHLAYFTPLDNPKPIILTSGAFEVVNAPSAVDLRRGLVYFVAAKDSSWDRHVFSVKFDGSDFKPVTDASESAYYSISFSHGAGYALLDYRGPNVPWQKAISTPSNDEQYEEILEKNNALSKKMRQYGLPSQIYQTVSIDGFSLPVVERRPPNFDPKKKYPVLFQLYGGPGSQTVSKEFKVNFQSYVAAGLGYIVVTVDGRGTGYIGRKARCIIRGNIGHYEARDQIETAKIWTQKPYVDETRMAIWGWSYGGFMTLKTLEQDAGETFQYGMAVAPVTDWRFYDSIYTERYMRTPQNNEAGYHSSAISNTTALAGNVRFLVIHGSADDNVHFQNTLTLIDKLDLDRVDNYDVHVFPDSDHSIYFHNANPMVYGRLSDWLVNAFNGEWLKTHKPAPNGLLQRALALLVRS